MGTAWPLPGCVSTRERDVGPAGLVRQHNTAAAEQAHVREAWPIVAPDVPSRRPAAALAPLRRRPEETPSWTGGSGRGRASRSAAPHSTCCRGRGRLAAGRGSAPGAVGGDSGRWSTRHRCATDPRRASGRGRRRHSSARRAQGTVRPRPLGALGTPAAAGVQADGPGGWSAGTGARRSAR